LETSFGEVGKQPQNNNEQGKAGGWGKKQKGDKTPISKENKERGGKNLGNPHFSIPPEKNRANARTRPERMPQRVPLRRKKKSETKEVRQAFKESGRANSPKWNGVCPRGEGENSSLKREGIEKSPQGSRLTH